MHESINIELTKRCNLHCQYCYALDGLHERDFNEIPLEAYQDFFRRFKAARGRSVLLTGGEVFLRDDLQDIAISAKEAGLSVTIFTNGTLIQEEDVQWLGETSEMLCVSLDGPESHHDDVRGIDGAFARTIETLRKLAGAKVRFMLQVMVTDGNVDDMGWLVKAIRDFDPIMVKLGHVCKVGKGRYSPELLLSEGAKVELKTLAGRLCEEANNFHTRVCTNLVTRKEYGLFYPSIGDTLVPWMYPDGTIAICYGNNNKEYWKSSDIFSFPAEMPGISDKRTRLIASVTDEASKMDSFELLELVNRCAREISDPAFKEVEHDV